MMRCLASAIAATYRLPDARLSRKKFTHEVEIPQKAQEAPDEWLSQVPPGSLVEQGAESGAPKGVHGGDQ